MTHRRTVLLAGLGAAGGLAVPVSIAQPTAFPSKPLRVIVGFPPGGASDILARLLAEKLRSRLGQAVVVENRPGGNTAIAMRQLAEAPADGHTLLLANTGMASVAAGNPALFDPRRYTPVGRVSGLLLIMVGNNSVQANTVRDLIAQVKANPGRYHFATSSTGGSDHIASELFNLRTGLKIPVIPYKGAAPAMTDLLAGVVQLRWDAYATARPYLEAGKLKAFGVPEAKRSLMAPNVPTMVEQGVQGLVIPGFYGFIAPAGTPAEPVNRLNQEVNEILALPDVRAKMLELGLEPIPSTPAEFGQLIRDSMTFFGNVFKDTGIKIE